MRNYVMTFLFLCLYGMARGGTEYEYRYWFDQETEIGHTGTSATGKWQMELDVEGLSETLHQLHVQVKDSAGRWSTPYSSYFLKVAPVDDGGLRVRYWFDESSQSTEVQTVEGVHSLGVSALSQGLHTVHYQALSATGLHSPTRSALFLKIPEGTEKYLARCFVDDVMYAEQEVASGGGIIDWELDVDSLPYGLHGVQVQVLDATGTVASVVQGFFMRVHNGLTGLKCLYTVDGGRTLHEAAATAEGSFSFDADISGLRDGVHQLLCMVVDEENTVIDQCNRYFIKKNETVVRYDYWVNDDVENVRTIGVPAVEPYRMMEMLEVGSYPLRSSYFHFEVEDGTPYIYAKNDLHVRFHSSSGASIEECRPYVDASSKQEVTDALLLQPGISRTDSTPGENGIRWYKVEARAEIGLSFRVSQPCSVQLFSPTGETLLDLSGEAVTDTFVCRVADGGTCYVALHDVTGQEELTTIDYLANEIELYQVTYLVDSVEYKREVFAFGDSIKVEAEPVKEGYTFSGWSEVPETMPAYDVTVTGSFSINKYLLTFVLDGDTLVSDSIEYGAEFTVPETTEREGYTFSGWGDVATTMPAQDLTYMAAYILNMEQTDAQGLRYLLNDAREAFVVVGYTDGLVADVTVPETLYGLPVNGVQDKALLEAVTLESIAVPASITNVGAAAFSGCHNLLVVEWNATAPLRAECFDGAEEYGNMLVFTTAESDFAGNVVVDGVAEEIVLTDGLPFRNPRSFTAKHISYSREFTKKTTIGGNEGWEAIVLPFDVQTIVSEEKGELRPFGMADFNTSLPCWLAGMGEEAEFAPIQEIKANEPFIMKVPNCEEYADRFNIEGAVTFVAEQATVYATEEQTSKDNGDFLLTGTYRDMAATPHVYALNEEEYTAADGNLFMPGGAFVADLRDVRPFEAYVSHIPLTGIRYLAIGGGAADGIEQILLKDAATDGTWYTIQGIRLSGKPTQRGVYIHNGKAVVVK